MARHRGSRVRLAEEIASARRDRRNGEAAFRAGAVGLIVRAILGATSALPTNYRWPVAIAVAMAVFVGLGLLESHYWMTRHRPRHEKPDHRR